MNLNEFWRAFSHNKGAVAGLLFMAVVVVLAVFAPWVAPHSPIEQYRDHFLQAPVWAGGSSQFLLGTDELGRDLLSRLIHGARLSLLVALVLVLLALVPGVLLGLVAAFAGKWVDAAIMRVMDIVMALPSLLMAVAIMAPTNKKAARPANNWHANQEAKATTHSMRPATISSPFFLNPNNRHTASYTNQNTTKNASAAVMAAAGDQSINDLSMR